MSCDSTDDRLGRKRNPKSTMPSGLGGANVHFYEFVIRKIAEQKLPDPPPEIIPKIQKSIGLEAIKA